MRTEILVACDDDAEAIWQSPSASDEWEGVFARAVDQNHLVDLWALLIGGTDLAQPPPAGFELLIDADDQATGPWIYEFPTEFEALLADIPNGEIANVAAAWAATQGMRENDWEADLAAELVKDLVELALAARESGELMMLKIAN